MIIKKSKAVNGMVEKDGKFIPEKKLNAGDKIEVRKFFDKGKAYAEIEEIVSKKKCIAVNGQLVEDTLINEDMAFIILTKKSYVEEVN